VTKHSNLRGGLFQPFQAHRFMIAGSSSFDLSRPVAENLRNPMLALRSWMLLFRSA
jgi:hypothetical protein